MSSINQKNATSDADNTLVEIEGQDELGNQKRANVITRTDDLEALAVDIQPELQTLLGRSHVYDFIHSSGWMRGYHYNDVNMSVSTDTVTLEYYYDSSFLGKATAVYTSPDNWSLDLERYLCEDDGDPLLDDDSTELNFD